MNFNDKNESKNRKCGALQNKRLCTFVSGRYMLLQVVFHSKFPIFANFLNIHKASPNTDHNIICMFLKRKTISKSEKSSQSYTNQGKITIYPEQMMVLYSNFNGIVLFKYSNICVNFKVDYLEGCLTHSQKFS